MGYAVGYIFATVWNKVHRASWTRDFIHGGRIYSESKCASSHDATRGISGLPRGRNDIAIFRIEYGREICGEALKLDREAHGEGEMSDCYTDTKKTDTRT